MDILTKKKTNKGAALVALALLVLPVIAKGLTLAGFGDYSDILQDIIKVISTIGAGGITVGLGAKFAKGEKVFTE